MTKKLKRSVENQPAHSTENEAAIAASLHESDAENLSPQTATQEDTDDSHEKFIISTTDTEDKSTSDVKNLIASLAVELTVPKGSDDDETSAKASSSCDSTSRGDLLCDAMFFSRDFRASYLNLAESPSLKASEEDGTAFRKHYLADDLHG